MDDHYPSWYPVQIRFRDLDPLAHVNNTVYFTYFEEARSYYFDQLDTWLNEWPSREEHQIRDMNEHERIYATGRSVMVWCNYLTGRPHPVPPSLRFAFEQMEARTFPVTSH